MSACDAFTILVGVTAAGAVEPLLYTVMLAIAVVCVFLLLFVDLGGARESAIRGASIRVAVLRAMPKVRIGFGFVFFGVFLMAFGVYGAEATVRMFYNTGTGLCTGAVTDFVAYPRIRPPVDVIAVTCASIGMLALLSAMGALVRHASGRGRNAKDMWAVPFLLRASMIGWLSSQGSLAFGWASGQNQTGFQPQTPRNLLFGSSVLLAFGLLVQTTGMLFSEDLRFREKTSTIHVMGHYFVGPKGVYFPLVTYTSGVFVAATVIFQYGFGLSVYTNQGQALCYFFLFGLIPLGFTAVARDTSYFVPYFLFMNTITYTLIYVVATIPDPALTYMLLDPTTLATTAYDNGLFGVALTAFILAAGYVVGPAGGSAFVTIASFFNWTGVNGYEPIESNDPDTGEKDERTSIAFQGEKIRPKVRRPFRTDPIRTSVNPSSGAKVREEDMFKGW